MLIGSVVMGGLTGCGAGRGTRDADAASDPTVRQPPLSASGGCAEECAEGEFCLTAVGECDGTGECRATPELCTMDYRPVCGCDGKTYGNECGAYAAGVSVFSVDGRCAGEVGADDAQREGAVTCVQE